MSIIKTQAKAQVKKYLGNGALKPECLFWSKQQLEGELLYVEYSKDNLITDEKMKDIEKDLNNGFKGYGIKVEVRKQWF